MTEKIRKETKGNNIGFRPSAIIEAKYELNRRQDDILNYVFSLVGKIDDTPSNLEYIVPISKIKNTYTNKCSDRVYEQIKKAVQSFEGKGFHIIQNEKVTFMSWFSHITYYNGSHPYIVIGLDPILKKMIMEAKQGLYYSILISNNIKSIYARRLYYHLKLFVGNKPIAIKKDRVDYLMHKFNVSDNVKNNFKEFKRLLIAAINELNEKSDINIEFSEEKEKRVQGNIKQCG